MSDKTYINGPKIPLNVYYYTDVSAFGKYLEINNLKLMHQQGKDGKVLGKYGNKVDLTGVIDAEYGALEFQENNG